MKKKIMILTTMLLCFTATPVFATQVKCGNIDGMPGILPSLFHSFVMIMKIVVPAIIVITGMIDFTKAVVANKDDAMGTALRTFLKRLIYGAILFMVVSLTQLIVKVAAGDDGGEDSNAKSSTIDCMDCFINNDCTDTSAIEEVNSEVDETKEKIKKATEKVKKSISIGETE